MLRQVFFLVPFSALPLFAIESSFVLEHFPLLEDRYLHDYSSLISIVVIATVKPLIPIVAILRSVILLSFMFDSHQDIELN